MKPMLAGWEKELKKLAVAMSAAPLTRTAYDFQHCLF